MKSCVCTHAESSHTPRCQVCGCQWFSPMLHEHHWQPGPFLSTESHGGSAVTGWPSALVVRSVLAMCPCGEWRRVKVNGESGGKVE